MHCFSSPLASFGLLSLSLTRRQRCKDLTSRKGYLLMHLFNKSFTTGTFTQSWKMAEVIPVPKSGDFNEPANMRRLSLLPILLKVYERLAHR